MLITNLTHTSIQEARRSWLCRKRVVNQECTDANYKGVCRTGDQCYTGYTRHEGGNRVYTPSLPTQLQALLVSQGKYESVLTIEQREYTIVLPDSVLEEGGTR